MRYASNVTVRLQVVWARQGSINWEDDWVESSGHVRSKVPGLAEHVGFANHDLARRALPPIQQTSSGDLYIEFDFDLPPAGEHSPYSSDLRRPRIAQAKAILAYHGFEVNEV